MRPQVLTRKCCLLILGFCGLALPGLRATADEAPAEATEPQSPETPQRTPRLLPGVQAGGQILLPSQWSLRPAGKQIKLGDFPVNIALHPSEPWAAILHAGYGEHEIVIVDLKRRKVASRVEIDQAFYGLCFSPDGKSVFASGAEHEVIHQFTFADGYLSAHRELALGEKKEKLVPAGLSVSPDGQTLHVCCAWGDLLCEVPLAATTDQPQTATPKRLAFAEGSYPYTSLGTAKGQRLYVSLWGKAAVAVVDLQKLTIDSEWDTPSHPTEMTLSPDEKVLYVSCANSNSVSVIDTATGRTLEIITSALHPQAPNGSTPNSLALSPDGKVLLVANADNNNLAVVNVSEPGKSRSLGFIPVGWYPTSVRFNRHDGQIYVANGKGLMSKANVQGSNPNGEPPASIREYIGGLFRGTLGVIDPPSPSDMAAYLKQAYACSPLRSDNQPIAAQREPGHPIPTKVGEKSPLKHCIYVIKENRTYDQVFGDMPEGNGDANLCIFPERVTPNHHALAREFVLLDNFYVEGEVSADGHEWTTAAYATDFVEKTWPLVYRTGSRGIFRYPSEGSLPIAFPSSGYIWDRCKEAGISYFSYGEFVVNGKTAADPGKAKVAALEGHFDPLFRSFDMDYPDVKRAARFIEELARYEKAGEMPQFILLRLPSDHTSGTSPGKPTPTAYVADNDLALGQVVEAVSRSQFWKDTAIFVVEDDAQNGSDHVDAHRTVALAISPYTRRKTVDSSMYSTASMLRTMELILGLEPMTQFDAAALPMAASFQAKPDFTPYQHRPAQVDLKAVNEKTAWGAKRSLELDFTEEDAADDLVLNEIVWKSVRGANSIMPPPVRASFMFALGDDDDDEEGDDDDD